MKSEGYSWRLSRGFKCELEAAARRERVSVSQLLERIVREWLKARAAAAEDDEAEQERLRASRCATSALCAAGIRICPRRSGSAFEKVS
jgi:hypothetical protein